MAQRAARSQDQKDIRANSADVDHTPPRGFFVWLRITKKQTIDPQCRWFEIKIRTDVLHVNACEHVLLFLLGRIRVFVTSGRNCTGGGGRPCDGSNDGVRFRSGMSDGGGISIASRAARSSSSSLRKSAMVFGCAALQDFIASISAGVRSGLSFTWRLLLMYSAIYAFSSITLSRKSK
jgi:hypothetical protein